MADAPTLRDDDHRFEPPAQAQALARFAHYGPLGASALAIALGADAPRRRGRRRRARARFRGAALRTAARGPA